MTEDEEEIAFEGDTGSNGSIMCSIAVAGREKVTKSFVCQGLPGHKVRTSIWFRFPDGRRDPVMARVYAYIDPSTGQGVMRLGMFSVDGAKREEIGTQLTWRTDVPIVDPLTPEELWKKSST